MGHGGLLRAFSLTRPIRRFKECLGDLPPKQLTTEDSATCN